MHGMESFWFELAKRNKSCTKWKYMDYCKPGITADLYIEPPNRIPDRRSGASTTAELAITATSEK